MNPQEAAALLLALDDASSSFLGFVRFMRPEWKVIPDFHLDLIDKLDRLERGTLTHPDGRPCYSMLINMPPRHSKSSIATELFPAYYILRDARRAVMSCAYNAELAADFGEKVRNYVTDPRALKAFPGFALSNLSKAKDFWRTQEGGQYAGVGIGGTTTGRPANCFVAGTMVATPNGSVPIEHLSPGDTVLSFDHIANKIVPKTIVATQSSLSADLITTQCSTGTTITSTSDHKFFTPSGYRPAASLSIGEELGALEYLPSLQEWISEQSRSIFLLQAVLSRLLSAASNLLDVQNQLPAHALGSRAPWSSPTILQPSLLRRSSLSGSQVRNMRRHHRAQDEAVLRPMSPKSTPSPADANVYLQEGIQTTKQPHQVLLNWLQERGPRHSHEVAWEPNVPAWSWLGSVLIGILQCAKAGIGSLQGALRALRLGQTAMCSPYRPEQAQQRSIEPDSPMLSVPRLHTWGHQKNESGLFCAHVTGSLRLDNSEPTTVYDIQVADTHNFFANGILVHNCLITDDPIKARDEAESATIRNKVWNYYVSALTTRKQPDVLDRPAIEIMILTRWHPDDPAGRIMATDEWKEGRWMHVCYAARTEVVDPTAPTIPKNELPVTDPRYNPNDTTPVPKTRTFKPLWPSRFDLDFLSRREKLNPREFASLYQQQPYVEGGNIVKGYWWRYYTTPQDTYPHVIIAADTAYKKTTTSDYSVVAVMAMDLAGDIYLLDILRGRWDFPELKRLLTHQNAKWRGRGLRAIYVEDRASGQSLIQELKNQSGMSVIAFKTISDKVSRLHSVTPLIEGGRVYIPQTASWLDDFVQELTAFPSVQNDDQVDALSLGLDILSKIPINGLDSFDIAPITNSLNHTLASKNSLSAQFKNKPLRFLGS